MAAEKQMPTSTTPDDSAHAVATYSIEGMTCGACVAAITNGLEATPGVASANISLVTERGTVQFDPKQVSTDQILERIDDCGFDAKLLSVKEPQQQSTIASTTSATLSVQGMTCGACSAAVTNGLQGLDGVSHVSVSLITERAHVEYDPAKIDPNQLIERIDDCGFDASIVSTNDQPPSHLQIPSAISTVKLKIFGMTCSSCTSAVESALLAAPGVKDAVVALALEEAAITYDSAVTSPRALVDAVKDAGFDAILASSADNSLQLDSLSRVKVIAKCKRDFLICLALGLPVIALSKLVPGVFPFLAFLKTRLFTGVYLDDVINLLLTLPIQFGIGAHFYKSTIKTLRHGAPTMDVLVCMSTSCAFFFSLFSVLYAIAVQYPNHPSTLWDTSAMLITFISAGKYLENKAKGQTSVALSCLISLSPNTATIYTNPEKYMQNLESTSSAEAATLEQRTVSSDLLQPGDVAVILPGEKIPGDGIVLFGESYVDESLITGESMPVSKKIGDSVLCGSINGHGRLDIKVTRAGNNTKLASIVQLVQDAQTSKTQVQRYADYIAGWFVPSIILLGLGTFFVWMLLSHMLHHPPKVFDGEQGKVMVCLRLCISVIVVACPCALGLATPTAVMVGTGVGASNGILIKGGAVLEMASRVTTVLFDKTGTLTTGKMTVNDFERLNTVGASLVVKAKSWWTLVAALEQNSEHPIARGIVAKAQLECGLEPQQQFTATTRDFTVLVGEGVVSTVELPTEQESYQVAVGNKKLFDSRKIEVPAAEVEKSAVAGQTVVFVGINNVYAGHICLSDTVRPNAGATVAALNRMGYSVGIVSGDNPSVVQRVAKQLGVAPTRAWGGVSPEGKLQIIEQLQSGDAEESLGYNMDGRGRGAEVVAFVGDGINDSPALAKASLGISLAGATDAAMEAADIVLIKDTDPLLDVAAGLHLSQTTFRRIKQNLVWAVIYNVLMIPFAMGVFLPFGVMLHPIVAGAAMAFSSVSVVVSSLMLKRWKCPEWIGAGESVPAVTGTRGEWGLVRRVKALFGGAGGEGKEHMYQRLSSA